MSDVHSSETWQLGDQSVQVTHLEKVYWPQAGFTKGDLLLYYRQIAPVALPYLKDRPVTLRMYPRGIEAASYYLRDCPENAPDWLRRVDYRPKTVSHAIPLPLIDTVAGLLWFQPRRHRIPPVGVPSARSEPARPGHL